MTPAVAVSDLTRHFGAIRAVERLTFDVAPGELFGIVGPDGAGKTTLLRMLAGVLRPSAGDAAVRGVSVARDPERVKRHIAYMAQRFGLYADLTVRENIEFYADLYGVSHADRPGRRQELYAFSGLGPFEDRLAGRLSGGMKQKLSLCCALIHQPDILILDEPTFGVDPISRRELWLILHERVAGGMTVVVATAYLDEAERCDRVALLHQGTLLALDRPQELQNRLRERIHTVRADRPRAARDLLRQQPHQWHAALFGDHIHLTLEDAARDWPRAKAVLDAGGITILEEGVAEPSLEDVFIGLVREASTSG